VPDYNPSSFGLIKARSDLALLQFNAAMAARTKGLQTIAQAEDRMSIMDKFWSFFDQHKPGGVVTPMKMEAIAAPSPAGGVTPLDRAAISMSDLTTQLKKGPLVHVNVTAPGVAVDVEGKGGTGRSAMPAKTGVKPEPVKTAPPAGQRRV
jgi:hypothetical protein